jgi:hypothetical protein
MDVEKALAELDKQVDAKAKRPGQSRLCRRSSGTSFRSIPNPGAPGDKAAFPDFIGTAADRYHCPMGRALEFVQTRGYQREGGAGTYRVYECGSCAGCPLATRRIGGGTKARRIMRDEYDDVRERAAERLKTEAGKEAYSRRAGTGRWPRRRLGY